MPLPSELYPHILLGRRYEGDLSGDETEGAGQEATTTSAVEVDSAKAWRYYSLDIASQLDGDFRVTDPEQALNQLKSDIKYANVSQYADLIIHTIEAGDGFGDPDLYINLNDSEPSRTSYDLRCQFWGEDVCVISG